MQPPKILLSIRRWLVQRPTTRLPALGTHHLERVREIRLDAPIAQVRARLLDPLDLSLHTPGVAFFLEAALHHLHHRLVELAVELAALAQVIFVAVLEPAVRVQVPAQFEQEVESIAGAGGERAEARDVWEEFEHAGAEGGGGQGVVEVVLETVEVKVDDGDFAVELGVQGLCGMAGRGSVGGGVHLAGYAWWNVCSTPSVLRLEER